jgi:predicted nucleic acid-binding protein
MKIVSNTGPIIGLAKIGKISLLRNIKCSKRVIRRVRIGAYCYDI